MFILYSYVIYQEKHKINLRGIWNDLPTVDRHRYFERTTKILKDYNELVEVSFVFFFNILVPKYGVII